MARHPSQKWLDRIKQIRIVESDKAMATLAQRVVRYKFADKLGTLSMNVWITALPNPNNDLWFWHPLGSEMNKFRADRQQVQEHAKAWLQQRR